MYRTYLATVKYPSMESDKTIWYRSIWNLANHNIRDRMYQTNLATIKYPSMASDKTLRYQSIWKLANHKLSEYCVDLEVS
jgi:hypothetical protein